ncbi:cytochrome P450 [Serendipita vermifera]|nr:cytochrome P450 [Serendipita vermifera]
MFRFFVMTNEGQPNFLDTSQLAVIVLAAITLCFIALKGFSHVITNKPTNAVYPPGPARLPLIGALRSFPKHHFFRRFCEWATIYGDIVYAPLPGMDVVVLNSYDAAHELLSKRSASTGERRRTYFLVHLLGWHWSMTFLPPGPIHTNQRKMLRKSIGSQNVSNYNSFIEGEVVKLAIALHGCKGNPAHTIQSILGRMITRLTYGTTIWEELGDGLAQWNTDAMHIFSQALFAFWPVDIFPLLRFIPSWFPGVQFRKMGQKSSYLTEKIRYKPYERAQELYSTGGLDQCIARDLMDAFGQDGDVRDALAILYTAASDTTTAVLVAFLHTMFLFPEISKKVFSEIESITYGERLPSISDRPQLPYTEAALKEALRWHPVLPVVTPHVNVQDEIINGYLIPKGTVIYPNNGLMLTDTKVWGDPEVFRPERFLEAEAVSKPNPITMMFGYGMRLCPGMHLADKVAFHVAATTMALFDVVPLEGRTIPDPDSVEYTDAALRHPIGFECQFLPRSKKIDQLLSTLSLED